MKQVLSFIFIFTIFSCSFSQQKQSWKNLSRKKNSNFYEVKKGFDLALQNQDSSGYKQYMRLANWAEPRVYPNGNMELASPLKAYNEYQKYVNDNINKTTSVCSANWTSVGPIATNADAPGSIGRVECVGLNPANNNELYVGSTKGGLWKTIDGGVSYVNNTDNFAYLGFSAVAISPSNNSIVYAGTGGIWDGTTLGLVKSIDAGNTWNHITTFPNIRISKILVNPLNAQSITLSSSAGLFKSYNGGLSWISMYTNQDFTDLEYKPNDTTTIYAITDNLFYKSIDGGGSFNTVVSSGITVSGLKNLIAVSQSDPNFVAIATISNSGSAMIYSSNNLGLNFSTNGMTPIVIGSDGNRNAFDVSPLNKLEMMFSGVYTYYTFDGGATVTYAGSSGLHVDTQEIKYSADGSSIYFSTDGGVYKGTSPSSSFVPINGNMNVSQIYSLGVSKTTAGKVVVGLQDNGSWFVNGSSLVWDRFNGGDGMECFFDPNNDNIIYSSSQNGVFYKTINNGVSTNSIMSGLTWGSGGWESPWLFDPNNSNTLFCGLGKNFYKSINAGTSWTLMSTEPSINYFQDIKIAKSNSSTIYACGGATIKSIDGGLTWTNIQNNLPFGFTSSFAINPLNENDVVITFGNKVYRSTTGGASWVDISLGLPNVRCNTVVFDPIPSKGFYVGTDVGVFYYVQSDANYLSFNQGMPFVPVTEIEVDLLGSKLYAATYGRGLWKSDLVDISTCPPIADFTITPTTCGALTVDFINTSVINPTSYSWNFGGGIPATSTATNPSISFTNPGVFSATLTTTNGFGISQMTHTFVVGGSSNIPMTQGFESSSFPPQGWSLSSSVSDGYDWFQHFSYGGFGNTYRSMFFNNWLCNSVGSHHDIVSNEYAVNNVSSLFLNFDVAHHQFSTINDSLIVWVSINCGTSWNRVYAKGSNQLKTALVTSSHPFNPTSSEWRTETVNLNSYVGANSLLLKFTNVNAYGDIIYVDNINLNNSIISGFTKREEDDMFSLFPNPTNGILNIRVKNSNQKCMIYNSVGAIIMMKNEVPEKINLEHLASGIYFIKIGTITQKIIKD